MKIHLFIWFTQLWFTFIWMKGQNLRIVVQTTQIHFVLKTAECIQALVAVSTANVYMFVCYTRN